MFGKCKTDTEGIIPTLG